jgi:lysyl-tRNA synthetase class 2
MELNELERQRLEKLNQLQAKGITPYPNRVDRTHTVAEAIAAYVAFEEEKVQLETSEGAPVVAVAGRLRAIRDMGKICFADIEDESGSVQLFIRIQSLGEETYGTLLPGLDLGDFVGAKGEMMRTRSGEISVRVETLDLLAKALSPLPVVKEAEKEGQERRFGGFSDTEERYRQRYADLATNPEVRQTFRIRAETIRALRRFLDERGFLEVETPVLQPIYGGAAARPFTTHHNQLHRDLFLRVSFELYLKRLLVGMFDRVYEIGRDFRNEGVSNRHNPEFTQLEFYAAYMDYHDVMELCETMVSQAAQAARPSASRATRSISRLPGGAYHCVRQPSTSPASTTLHTQRRRSWPAPCVSVGSTRPLMPPGDTSSTRACSAPSRRR